MLIITVFRSLGLVLFVGELEPFGCLSIHLEVVAQELNGKRLTLG